jgi:hypothetical protein
MAFSLLFLIASIVILVAVFIVTYLLKGLKAALIAAGAVLLTSAVGFVVLINLITNPM